MGILCNNIRSKMRVLVTGSDGFIGKNMVVHLNELEGFESLNFTRQDSIEKLKILVSQADAIIHLAGENRPKNKVGFEKVNVGLSKILCDTIKDNGKKIKLIFASSIQADQDSQFGRSKHAAEKLFEKLSKDTDNSVFIYRLTNTFGKWSKPNYNSVVSTFCYNIAHGLPIQINDSSTKLNLVYVDDVISELLRAVQSDTNGLTWGSVEPVYPITLGKLANQIEAFKSYRSSLVSERVGSGIIRSLYSTFVSYLSPEQFSYDLPQYGDERGTFVEILKTHDSGQFSYFTAHPGVTRGSHYHHSKSEKFLVIKGSALFGFRHIVTNETHEILTSSKKSQVVETVPGWTHEITNVGKEEMFVILWANEIFDKDRPDTINCKV